MYTELTLEMLMAKSPKKAIKNETAGLRQLKAWLEKKKLSPSEGAAEIGVSRQLFHKWLKGGQLERTSALLIESKLKIPANDFFTN
jgi:hypothetical protein